MYVVYLLIIGLLAGSLARALVPGRERMGWLGTIVLGIVGSLVGGFLGNLFHEGDADIRPTGIIGSIIGAIIVLLVYRRATGRDGAGV